MDDSFSSAVFPYLEFKLRVNRPHEGRTDHCVAKAELMVRWLKQQGVDNRQKKS